MPIVDYALDDGETEQGVQEGGGTSANYNSGPGPANSRGDTQGGRGAAKGKRSVYRERIVESGRVYSPDDTQHLRDGGLRGGIGLVRRSGKGFAAME